MSPDELFAAIKAGDLVRVEELLAQEPALADARDERGMSAVLTAAYWQQPAIVAALLARGPQLSFHEAAAVGATRGIDRGLAEDPGLLDSYAADGFTALGLASFFGHAGAVALLLARGASPSRPSANDMRVAPLHSAAAGGHQAIVQMLLDRGADPRASQEGGFTALHSAAQGGRADIVELLLAHGADPDATTDDGRTPRDLALEEGHEGVAELL